jgi:hypothetical protein
MKDIKKLYRYTPRRASIAPTHSVPRLWMVDGGEWSASRPDCAFAPGKGPTVPIGQETGWSSEPVWTQRLQENPFASVGDRVSIARLCSPTYIPGSLMKDAECYMDKHKT